jgi:hypothetical protein
VGFLTAASYYYLGRIDIFREYYTQLMKTFPQGRYIAELKAMQKNVPPVKPAT